jgi:hypothetical protein
MEEQDQVCEIFHESVKFFEKNIFDEEKGMKHAFERSSVLESCLVFEKAKMFEIENDSFDFNLDLHGFVKLCPDDFFKEVWCCRSDDSSSSLQNINEQVWQESEKCKFQLANELNKNPVSFDVKFLDVDILPNSEFKSATLPLFKDDDGFSLTLLDSNEEPREFSLFRDFKFTGGNCSVMEVHDLQNSESLVISECPRSTPLKRSSNSALDDYISMMEAKKSKPKHDELLSSANGPCIQEVFFDLPQDHIDFIEIANFASLDEVKNLSGLNLLNFHAAFFVQNDAEILLNKLLKMYKVEFVNNNYSADKKEFESLVRSAMFLFLVSNVISVLARDGIVCAFILLEDILFKQRDSYFDHLLPNSKESLKILHDSLNPVFQLAVQCKVEDCGKTNSIIQLIQKYGSCKTIVILFLKSSALVCKIIFSFNLSNNFWC